MPQPNEDTNHSTEIDRKIRTVEKSQRQEPVVSGPKTISCEDQISALGDTDEKQSLRAYFRALPFVVVRANITPVVYLKKPTRTKQATASSIARALVQHASVHKEILRIKRRYRDDQEMMRRIFLAEGYFFEDRERIATTISKEIHLTDLFTKDIVYRLRGDKLTVLRKNNEDYVDEQGHRASIRLNDRVSTTRASLFPQLHLDMEEVRNRTGAVRTEVVAVRKKDATITLHFPNGESRISLISLKDGKTSVSCIGGDQTSLASLRSTTHNFWIRHHRVIESAEALVKERPLFDEPKDEGEEVQEDGELRLAWKEAYRNRKKTFWYREVEYNVFDRKGNPVPPEVCVDFIIDTWERASGTWYTPRGAKPHRTDGDIDFYALEGLSRRYISGILNFALKSNSPFERYDIPRRDWVPLEERRKFVKKLKKNTIHYQEGDLLVIHGLREEDMAEHYHTVLVLRTDPTTGIPTSVADNQGRPRISTLIQAMRAAPKRSIKHRLRLKYEKMREITSQYRATLETEKDK